MKPIPKFWKNFLTIFIFLFLGLFYAQKINFVTADLGRHIKNGEIFFKTLKPISTNFYSYTEPNYPTINHHWGTGVVFYLLWKFFGFKGLHLFYILLNLIAFSFFFRIAEKRSNFIIAMFFAVISIPLIAVRCEIRPEGFSYLFLGIYYFLLNQFEDKKINFKTLLFLFIPFQILWVNLHIFFIMGIFIIGAFFVNSFFYKRDFLKKYSLLLILTILSSFINPFGLKGFLEPFTILKEYGYMIVENQSVIFMQKRFLNPEYFHFELLFLILLITFVISLKKWKKFPLTDFLLISFFSALSWKMIRGFPMFALFFVPVVSSNFQQFFKKLKFKTKELVYRFMLWPSVIIISSGFFIKYHYFSPIKRTTGIGLFPGIQSSALFFKKNNIKGPIFNNYDIGGYLIFHLFPEEKVFVDNRPEAYSVSFFKNIYIPMQENEKIWKELDRKYNFNVIYFYRHDLTPWGQPFLIRRIKDPLWAPVFVDGYTLILLKRNKKNKGLIKLYELPERIFKIVR